MPAVPATNNILRAVFSLVCAQEAAHSWAPGGTPLPFCQRCTGLYVGAAIAAALLLLFRPAPNAPFRWVNVMLLLMMAPFGFQLLPQGPFLRTMSGHWFAFGIVGLLWIIPGAQSIPDAVPQRRRAALCLVSGLSSVLLLPVFARWGAALASFALPLLAVLGMLVFAVLICVNVAFFFAHR